MIRPLRAIHKLTWLIITPVLLLLIFLISNPALDLYPDNDELPHRTSKGALP